MDRRTSILVIDLMCILGIMSALIEVLFDVSEGGFTGLIVRTIERVKIEFFLSQVPTGAAPKDLRNPHALRHLT